MKHGNLSAGAWVALALALAGGPVHAQSNGVLREVWWNIGGVTVPDLTNHPAFPNSPSLDEVLTSGLEAPLNVAENYGQRLRALLTPTLTGTNYVFYIASDDASELWLSTDDTPANRRLIARVATWTDSRVWQETRDGNNLVQKSTNIALTAGRSYYLEVLMKEGGGGDNVAVTWQRPGEAVPANGAAPIPNTFLRPYGVGPPVITVQPGNATVVEGGLATFSVQLGRTLGASYQWIRNGTNIPGATASSYAFGPVPLADGGSTFRCFVTNPYGSTNSATATLTVNPDVTRPILSSLVNLGDHQLLTVLFSEAVELASATNESNYTLNNGAAVLSATLSDDGTTAFLQTTPLASGVIYTLTVNDVRDRAQTPNTILPNSQKTVSLTYTPLDVSYVTGASEPAGPSSRRTGLVISEIMYHPTNRADGRNLEFIEIHNSNPWPEDLGHHRLSGAADFKFPPGTTLGAQSYLVVAPKPADLQAVYGISGVLGPLVNSNAPGNLTNVIDNGGGTLRLRDEFDSVLLEAIYDDAAPYPVAPDGAGHSLVLARPTFGERNPRAWAASDRVGGTPRTNEVVAANPQRTVLINEFLAHTDPPQEDFIELFNYGASTVNLAGCILTDNPETNKFIIPPGTSIAPRGFVVFTQTELGFALDATGETIYLKNANATKVLDAVKFGDQENGISVGRYPDGAPSFSRLIAPTPGTNNARLLVSEVVLNEIMYNPFSGDADEFVELYNRGTAPVDLSKWRLRGGISFTFPNDTFLGPDRYLVVANNATNLIAIHSNLTTADTLGNYAGKLGNGGDTIILDKPDEVITTNLLGQLATNRIHIVVDEVAYGTGGRWGQWADGDGSSLELIDAHGDKRQAASWADSDETGKSGWTTVEFAGLLDHGAMANADQLHVFLQGAGECLIDNVEVIAGGNNVVANGTFESGVAGWFFQGTHAQSHWETSAGYASSRSLHLVATGRGDTGANRIRTALTQTLANGSTATLRCRVRWLKGHPELLLRLHGNYLEATGNIVTTRHFGSPGTRNTRAQTNAGPVISDVRHTPVLPAAGQTVTVTAQVSDPDGLAALVVKYRVDPGSNYNAAALVYHGAGLYSASLPGQSAGTTVAFYLEAQDNFASRATTRFPSDAPAREGVVRWGESTPAGTFGTYRMWVTQRNVTRWATREKNSNEPLDGTFVYGNSRVVYNMSTYYKGSPWHTPGYSSPDGNACDYKITFPKDDLLLGIEDMVLATVGNLGSDPSYQGEPTAFWIARKLGAPYMYRRYIRLFFNGQLRQTLYEDSGQPNGDTVSQFYPDDEDGDLHKVEDWFEFDDSGDNKLGNIDATLQPFTTAGGAKKTARYRWIFRPRGGGSSSDFTNLFALVDALNAAQPEPFETRVKALVDLDGFMRHLAMQRIVGNWDSWGYARGKNDYLYKPRKSGWTIMPWDIDFVFNTGGTGTSDPLFGSNEPTLDRLRSWPVFQRAYWRAFEDAVNGPMAPAVMNPMLDAKYAALSANGAGPQSPQGIKDYTAARRTYILGQLATVAATFRVNGTTNFSTSQNLITLTGTAPIGVETITVNGVAYPASWSALTSWSLRVALESGSQSLVVQGWDNQGRPVNGATATLTVTYTGLNERAEDKVVLNEIMYQPLEPDAEFVEIHNSSVANAFDLSNWRLEGLDGFIPPGTILNPGAFLVVARDKNLFGATYGSNLTVVAEFAGRLENTGEAIRLVKPGATPAQDRVIDQVRYEALAPWPTSAAGGGFSLQLLDPAQDNGRVANWSGGIPEGSWRMLATNALMTGTNLYIWLDGPGDVFLDDLSLVPASGPLAGVNVLQNSGFEGPFNTGWSLLGTNLTNSAITTDVAHSGQASLHVVSTGLGSTAKAIVQVQIIPNGASNVLCTLSYWYRTGTSGANLTVRTYPGSAMQTRVTLATGTSVARSTPGTNNSVRTTLPSFPRLWLNEIQPWNITGPTDRFGHRHPWVELHNNGTNAISLAGFHLATNYSGVPHWSFPNDAAIDPGAFLVVWLDGQPEESANPEWHAGVTVPPTTGSLALYATNASLGGLTLLDYLNYSVPSAGRSYGDYPDGNPAGRQLFSIVTPGATNNPAGAAVAVFINEWMADNTATLADPADGNYEDWFELYNPGDEAVDLSGYYLTDNLTNTAQWQIPDGISIPARGYLLVWADGEPGQNGPGVDLHTSFALAKGGEAIGLFGPGAVLIDAVVFGPQTNDVSQGRFPDGATPLTFMRTPTPRAANVTAQSNFQPVLDPLSDQTIDTGSLLTFTVSASDSNYPPQPLTFSLEPGAPDGAIIGPTNGVFAWIPAPAQGPGIYPITVRVTDDGAPPLSDTATFTVTVNVANQSPVLQPIGDRRIYEETLFVVTNLATDPDGPAQTLTYRIDSGAQPGMTLDPQTGVLSWIPAENQAPEVYFITVKVTDDGAPPRSDLKGFTLTVEEVNRAPDLAPIAGVTNLAGTPIVFTATATDADLPAHALTFGLLPGAPMDARIDPHTGAFTWTPTDAGTYPITVRATDNGVPPLFADQTFSVVVKSVLRITHLELVSGDAIAITWQSEPGQSYQVQAKPTVDATEWSNVGSPIPASGPALSTTNSLAGQVQQFYRVIQAL